MNILKGLQRFFVRKVPLPASQSPILGTSIDAMNLPEGHLVCECGGFLFEPWAYLDNNKVELGCMKCNQRYNLLFPLDVKLGFRNTGRFTCKRHKTAGFVVIHNIDTISIGCQHCITEINIQTKNAKGLTLV